MTIGIRKFIPLLHMLTGGGYCHTMSSVTMLIRIQPTGFEMISDIQEQETETMINTLFSFFLLIGALLLVPNSLMANDTFVLRPYYPTTTLNGMTHPLKEMTSTSEVNGKCKTIYADKGEIIPTSGALAELDTTFIRLEIEANKIARVQAQRKLDQEKKTLARYTVLKDKNSTSEATFDEVALNFDLYTYTLQKLKIEETHLLEQLARHVIMAPPGWRVIERFAEPGEYIQAGTAIARLGDFRSLLIRLAVTYEELQSLKELKTIPLILPEIAQTVDAEIHQTSPVFDAKTRKIPMELIITAPREGLTVPLRGGMRAELVFKTTSDTNTFLVPLSALISRYEAHWLVQPDGTKLQVLLLGKSENKSQAIVSGDMLFSGMQAMTNPTKLNKLDLLGNN